MKHKYLMITGLAFCEQGDMDRLSSYAKKGWILESIKGCLFYKLKKAEPQDIVYSVDYQYDADDEYFALFEEAGWTHVVTAEKGIHIFSAKKGTEPIYSDSESQITKYMSVMKKMKKYSIISGIFLLVSIAAAAASTFFMEKLFQLFVLLSVISLIAFVISLMPYAAFSSRIKQIKKCGRCVNDDSAVIKFYLVNMFCALILIPIAISELKINVALAISTFVVVIVNLSFGCRYFLNKKNNNKSHA